MKKKLQKIIFGLILITQVQLYAQSRYLSEVFNSVNVTSNVIYGTNYSLLLKYTQGGPIFPDTLKADVYEPVGDTLYARPTIFLAHSGSGFPIFYNTYCVGDKTDSAIAEQCRQFARRGYTAIALNYRLGWNPNSLDQDIRAGSLLQQAGRVVQDIRACIRFFKDDAIHANTYHIDTGKIILGGNGSGGTFAIASATLHPGSYNAQISLPKFLSATTNSFYYFTAGTTYFDSTYFGNVDGYGGDPNLNNSNNTPGMNSNIHFCFAEEGLLPDSTWLWAGDPPMVCFQNPTYPYDPWDCGPVYNSVGGYISDVCGGHTLIREVNDYNNNYAFQNNNWNDPYTLTAQAYHGTNPNYDGLYPIQVSSSQASPWEWWDSTTCYQAMIYGLGFTQGHADTVWQNSKASNPDMSKTKALLYIDTIMGYLNPRIVAALNLNTGVGINDLNGIEKSVTVYPNPATAQFSISLKEASNNLLSLDITDISGRIVRSIGKPYNKIVNVPRGNLDAGVYLIRLKFAAGEVVKRVALQ